MMNDDRMINIPIIEAPPVNVILPDVIKLGSSFFTLLIESFTSSLMWSIPMTFPSGPTCGATQGTDNS